MAVLLSLLSWLIISVTLGAQRELTFWAVMGLGLARWQGMDAVCIRRSNTTAKRRYWRRQNRSMSGVVVAPDVLAEMLTREGVLYSGVPTRTMLIAGQMARTGLIKRAP